MVQSLVLGVVDESMTTPLLFICTINLLLALTGLFSTTSCGQREGGERGREGGGAGLPFSGTMLGDSGII